MYDHPIKRAGLAFNRILLSNTRVALPGFQGVQPNKFKINLKVRKYSAGKEVERNIYNEHNLDELFPGRK